MREENKNFFRKVYEVAKLIPYGRVTSYGAIAKYLGAARSARMVGWALNKCHTFEFHVPAHRVVNHKGELSGRNQFPTPTMMQEMLEQEGVEISNHKVIDFKDKFWHPEELET